MAHGQRGFTLIEMLISIALIGAMSSVFGMALVASALRTRARVETQAIALAEGAVTAARSLPLAAQSDRTDAPILGITERRGTWTVAQVQGAPSAPNALTAASRATAVSGITGAIRVPVAPFRNGTLDASFRMPSGSPSGWRAGLLLRSRDLGNGYRYSVGANTVAFERFTDGVTTTLYTLSTPTTEATWVALGITTNGSQITLRKDGISLTTLSDSTWNVGDLGLFAVAGALPAFDDVVIAGDATGTWGFDADPADRTPAEWRTVSVTDFQGGTWRITIDRPTADQSLRRIRADVEWQTSRGTSTVSAYGYAP